MKKRGAIEVQFNWIFVLIVGVIIFSFFIAIANKQREFTENRISILIKKNIDTFMKASESGSETLNEIDIPKSEILFTCDERGVSNFEVGRQGFKEDLANDIIFAPRRLKGGKLYFWTKDFKVPFKVASVLYITNDKIKYVFILEKEGNFVRALHDEFPEQLDKMMVAHDHESDVVQRNYDYYIFITKTEPNEVLSLDLRKFDNDYEGIIIVNIKPDSENSDVGEIIYYYGKNLRKDSRSPTPYLGRESIYGAIFSTSDLAYECNLKKLLRKTNLVSEIYRMRTEQLSDAYQDVPGPCSQLYERPLDNLEVIEANSQDLTNFDPILGAAGELVRNNENFDRVSGCPNVY